MIIPEISSEPFTDYRRWRLVLGDGGRHTWTYISSEEESSWPQSDIDRYWLGMKTEAPNLTPAKTPFESASNGYKFLQRLQAPDGHFAGEYGGPTFLLPGVVIGMHICGIQLKHEERLEMIRYLLNHAHPADGGWGLHVEGHSTVLGTALSYISLRLLGADSEHPALVKARATLHSMGGAAAAPSWGKFWMTILNVYDWDGNNPVPPELWLLPDWIPMHPWRWWIHIRVVYLPMSYLYRQKFQGEVTPLILALRQELYTQPYESIDWPAQRNNIAQVDLYTPHTLLLDVLNTTMSYTLEACPFPPLQRAALKRAYELICHEDENTEYQNIAPVSKMMQMICRFHAEGRESDAVQRHVEKIADFLWLGHEGMMVSGTNGSQVWDAAFISQAIVESGLADLEENRPSALKMLDWIDKSQITENPKHPRWRQPTKGAWGFSTKEQGYTLSDCTGEALKSVLYLQNRWPNSPRPVSDERIFDAVNILLSMQNSDGGFAAYELIRGPAILEAINPAEIFGNIMIEWNYPECTTSVITALSVFQKYYPDYRKADIQIVLEGAIKFLHSAQKPEGGWYGSWGICFNYATMFALESLALVGETYATSESVRRACKFLLDHQMEDGGWGESFESATTEKYVHHEKSQVVGTSWAVMALMYAGYPVLGPIERGVKLVMDRQLPNGEWAQEAIEGVFNKNCMIAYPNFKLTFTIWMLGKADLYLKSL